MPAELSGRAADTIPASVGLAAGHTATHFLDLREYFAFRGGCQAGLDECRQGIEVKRLGTGTGTQLVLESRVVEN